MGLLISLSFKTKGCMELIALHKELKIFFVLTLFEFLDCLFCSETWKVVGVAAELAPQRSPTLPRKP